MQPTELEVFRDRPVEDIACGKFHTLFLIDGQVWATGANRDGQIGNGTNKTQYKPIVVEKLSDVVSISAWHSSGALTHDGTAYVWGIGEHKRPFRIADKSFRDMVVGGTFTLLTD